MSRNINKLCFLMRPRLIDGDLNFFIGRTSKTFGKTRKQDDFGWDSYLLESLMACNLLSNMSHWY